jgi:ATP-dependent Clp protease ATP-binding subunit ClpC
MFERYDEPARRTLFFARFEASKLGVRSIETEHLLLGLMREPRGPAGRLLLTLPLTDVRKELESNRTDERIETSVEIPFSAETKRVLHHACDEADGLTHRHIGPEHLLLGLMKESDSRAATTLARYGMQLDGAREQIRELSVAMTAVPKSAVQAQLERIMESARQLSTSLSGNPDATVPVELLLLELETLKSLLDEQE